MSHEISNLRASTVKADAQTWYVMEEKLNNMRLLSNAGGKKRQVEQISYPSYSLFKKSEKIVWAPGFIVAAEMYDSRQISNSG